MSYNTINRNNNQSRNNNFRNGDNRRPHPNGYQNSNSYRNNWIDRTKGQTEWRSDNSYRNANRNPNRDSSQSTSLPGIPVNRNQSSTPFISNDTEVDKCANPSGDQNCEPPIDSITKELTSMDIKEKETVSESEVNTTETNEVKETVTESTSSSNTTEAKKESEIKNEPKVNTNGTGFTPRRNTVGSEYQFRNQRNFANRRNGNEMIPMNGNNKFERFHSNNFNTNNNFNKMQTNDTNKRITQNNNNKGYKKYNNNSTPANDYINYMPVNPYMANNMFDAYNPLAQYLIPNPYYSTPLYHMPPTMMAPTSAPTNGEMNGEMAGHQNHGEGDRSGKTMEQNSSLSSDLNGMSTYFVPFKPSPQIPYPPKYFGNIIPYSTEKGITYFFQSVIPPNIALLQLEVEQPTGLPILPSNCFTTFHE